MVADSGPQDEIVARMMGWAAVEPRRMFGADCYLVAGRMFAFFQDAGVVVKVPPPRREALLADARAKPFTVSQGTPFGDWLHLRLSRPADASLRPPRCRGELLSGSGSATSPPATGPLREER